MKFPPVESAELVALGMDAMEPIGLDNGTLVCGPSVPKMVRKLIVAAMASPPPEGDRLAYLRHIRDLLMGLTDYTQANDSPLNESQRTAWATYRQALRDLPSVYSGEGPIPWPQEPA